MDFIRVKTYAKINLTLEITGTRGGYHMLDSVVASTDLFDVLSVRKRRDSLVGITMRGCGSESIPFESNNAIRAAEAFVKKYATRGCDITVDKNIPLGAGLGGSSADAAGALRALAALYGTDDPAGLKLLADGAGSDTRYMLGGGFARLFGRGDEVRALDSPLKAHILLLIPPRGVSTPQCYSVYDGLGGFGGDSASAEAAICSGDVNALARSCGNALFKAACSLNGDIAEAAEQLLAFDPLAVNMTGSGSGVYALFENSEYCAYAKSRYRGKFAAYVLKCGAFANRTRRGF